MRRGLFGLIHVERGLQPARMSWELQLERRLERGRGFVECLASDVTVGSHHGRRDVAHLRLDDPVSLTLLRQSCERRVASIVEADVIESSRLS